MAIKGNIVVVEDDITLTCDSVASQGQILVHKTSGSGIALGESHGVSQLVANPSGYKVAGVLLTDVVDIDETRYHRNLHKDEVTTGDPVRLLRKGRVFVSNIIGTPAVDDIAYLDSSGNFTPTAHATGGTTAKPKIGKFISIKDADGYAGIDVNLPIV